MKEVTNMYQVYDLSARAVIDHCFANEVFSTISFYTNCGYRIEVNEAIKTLYVYR